MIYEETDNLPDLLKPDSSADEETNATLPENVRLAHDGLKLEFEI